MKIMSNNYQQNFGQVIINPKFEKNFKSVPKDVAAKVGDLFKKHYGNSFANIIFTPYEKAYGVRVVNNSTGIYLYRAKITADKLSEVLKKADKAATRA